jgi:hypothetical protein
MQLYANYFRLRVFDYVIPSRPKIITIIYQPIFDCLPLLNSAYISVFSANGKTICSSSENDFSSLLRIQLILSWIVPFYQHNHLSVLETQYQNLSYFQLLRVYFKNSLAHYAFSNSVICGIGDSAPAAHNHVLLLFYKGVVLLYNIQI